MHKEKVLIVAHTHNWLVNAFIEKGFNVVYDASMSYQDALEHIKDAVGIIAGNRWGIDKRLISQASQLRWIGRLGSGMEKIDTVFAHSLGITCYSSPEGNSNAVAEHALGMLLALRNNIVTAHNQVVQHNWLREQNRGTEIFGKTVGIIGFGHTGKAFANLLAPFQTKILVVDIVPIVDNVHQVKQVDLNIVQQEADIISFHLPLNNSTKHLANTNFFDGLSKQPIIINTSRGSVIETSALIKALQQQQVSGATLDVLENEDLKNYSAVENQQLETLLAMQQVIITPHIAGYSHEALLKMSEVLFNKLPI
jgi:D-3-phosphoglycerate dehydrogenase / 2-oxoglutarate reductase